MNNYTNSHLSLLTYIIILIVLATKILSIYYMQSKRSLPIEPDDALVYISNAKSFYDDIYKNKQTTNSIKTITSKTFEKAKTQEKIIINKINFRFTKNLFIFYSISFGFFTNILDIDELKVWWASTYLFQILLIFSFILLCKNLCSDKISFNISLIGFLYCSYFFNPFYMATPFSYCVVFGLLGITLIESRKRYLKNIGYVFKFLSLILHPFGFFILLFYVSYLLLKSLITQNDWIDHLKKIITLSTLLLIIFLIESVLRKKFLINLDFLVYDTLYNSYGLNMNYLKSSYDRVFNKFKYFINNYSLFKSQIIGFLIFISSLVSIFLRKNYKLLFLIGILNISILLSIFHVQPNWPGELGIRILTFSSFFFIIAYSELFSEIFEKLNMQPKIKYIIFYIFLIASLGKMLHLNYKVVDKRANKNNFNFKYEKFKNSVLENITEDYTIIVDEYFTLHLLMPTLSSNKILFKQNFFNDQNFDWEQKFSKDEKLFYIGKNINNITIDKNVVNINSKNSIFIDNFFE